MLNELNSSEIISSLKKYDGKFPKSAIENSINFGVKLESDLLKIIENIIEKDNVNNISDEDAQAFLISLYLLANFRSEMAYNHLINMCKNKGDYLDKILGDCLTEGLHRILGSTFNGDLNSIREIIFDSSLNLFIRDAATKCFLVLWKNKIITRDQVIVEFKNIFSKLNNDFELRAFVICLCLDIYADELIDDIKLSFSNNLVDESIVDFKSVESTFKIEKSDIINEFINNTNYDLIDDPINEMGWWNFWERDEEDHNITPKNYDILNKNLTHLFQPSNIEREFFDKNINIKKTKIGRNEKCTCGSGLKYKKCCLLSKNNML